MNRLIVALLLAISVAACSTSSPTGVATDANTSGSEQPAEDGVAAVGEQCGTIANIKCGDDAFCDIDSPSVGMDLAGTCQARPEACPDIAMDPMPCGRDGKRHATECHANAIGVDIITEGADSVCGDAS